MSSEDIVRRYLAYLDDPSVLRDDAAVAEARRKAQSADDVVERLRLLSEADRLENPDGADLRRQFVSVLKGWADDEGITMKALKETGVPADDLRAAGYQVGGRSRRRGGGGRRTGGGTGVTMDEVRAAVPSSGTFTTRSLMDASGSSPGTVRKAMKEMLEAGEIVDRGLDPNWEGPGRVPTLYSKA